MKKYLSDFENNIVTKLTTREAVDLILKLGVITSADLSRIIAVSPQTLSAYKKDRVATLTVADKFMEYFLVKITDVGKIDRAYTQEEVKELLNVRANTVLHI